MKKDIAIIASLIMVCFTACQKTPEPSLNTPSMLIRISGIEYQKNARYEGLLEEIEVVGTITSYKEYSPTEDDQTNIQSVVGAPYGTYNNHLYVLLEDGWYHFRRVYDDRASFMVQGKIYHCTGSHAVMDIANLDEKGMPETEGQTNLIERLGQLETFTGNSEKYPENDGECNVADWVGASYGIYQGKMYLYYNGVWMKCYDVTELIK